MVSMAISPPAEVGVVVVALAVAVVVAVAVAVWWGWQPGNVSLLLG
jgi:hypothetical protein